MSDATTVATGCPLQTQIACFRIKTHGHPLIEDQYLGTGVYNGRGHAVAGADLVPEDSIWHLSESGQLISVQRRAVLQYIDAWNPDQAPQDYVEGWWVGQAKIFALDDAYAEYSLQYQGQDAKPYLVEASCELDCMSKAVTCTGPPNSTQLYTFDPDGQIADGNYVEGVPYWEPDGFSDLNFRLMWYNIPKYWDMLPVTLTAEETDCPCLD